MRRLARLQPIIAGIVERQLDELEAAGPGADLASTVAFPVPFQTITSLLGMTKIQGSTISCLCHGSQFSALDGSVEHATFGPGRGRGGRACAASARDPRR